MYGSRSKRFSEYIVSWPLLKAESMLYPELDDEHCLYRYEGLRDDAIKVTQYESRLKNLLSKKDLMDSEEKIEDDVSASETETKTLQNDEVLETELRDDDREEEEEEEEEEKKENAEEEGGLLYKYLGVIYKGLQ